MMIDVGIDFVAEFDTKIDKVSMVTEVCEQKIIPMCKKMLEDTGKLYPGVFFAKIMGNQICFVLFTPNDDQSLSEEEIKDISAQKIRHMAKNSKSDVVVLAHEAFSFIIDKEKISEEEMREMWHLMSFEQKKEVAEVKETILVSADFAWTRATWMCTIDFTRDGNEIVWGEQKAEMYNNDSDSVSKGRFVNMFDHDERNSQTESDRSRVTREAGVN